MGPKKHRKTTTETKVEAYFMVLKNYVIYKDTFVDLDLDLRRHPPNWWQEERTHAFEST